MKPGGLIRSARLAAIVERLSAPASPYIVQRWIKDQYGLNDRSASRLVKVALQYITRQHALNSDVLKMWHRQERIKLIEEAKFAEDYSTAARVLADLAKIDDVYPSDKVDVNHSGKIEIAFQWPEKTIEAEIIDDKGSNTSD